MLESKRVRTAVAKYLSLRRLAILEVQDLEVRMEQARKRLETLKEKQVRSLEAIERALPDDLEWENVDVYVAIEELAAEPIGEEALEELETPDTEPSVDEMLQALEYQAG